MLEVRIIVDLQGINGVGDGKEKGGEVLGASHVLLLDLDFFTLCCFFELNTHSIHTFAYAC